MPLEAIVIWLIVGAISGWLAGQIVVGAGLGLIGDIIVGILGSFVAGYMFPKLGIHLGEGILAYIIDGAVGGIVVLLIVSLIKRR